jgi:SpoVK/Ycf46/Vps4 family AAA+-type ATPase
MKRDDLTQNHYYMHRSIRSIIELWALRIIITLNGHREFMHQLRGSFSSDELAYFLGLKKFIGMDSETYQKRVFSRLDKRLEKLERIEHFTLPNPLERNLKKVSRLIGLNHTEWKILLFAVLLKYYEILDDATRTLNDVSTDKLAYILSILLQCKLKKVKKALSPQGRLARSGLLSVDRDASHSISSKLDILSRDFADRMMTLDGEIEEMIRDSVRKCSPTTLSIRDFNHLEKDLSLLLPYLKQALEGRQKGVNILFYGHPGTGKTELTKAIAKTLGVRIYEVSYADADDEPISGERRLKAYKVGQSFFSNENVILMFDEIEDVVGESDLFSPFASPKQQNKGWMNRILENNPIPTIWITNDIYSMDRAMVRRFDLSLEIPIPPKSKRKEIILKECGALLSDTAVEKIAQHTSVAPAVVSRAAKVISGIGRLKNTDEAFESIINHTLKAQGYPKIKSTTEESLPSAYDPDYIHTDTDLRKLAEGIRHNPQARLCLYGVPGTGKSAFGKWIAQLTHRPFLLKKGSDLIDMYVGGTEKNIANAFREAREEGAVLVFDEVDSFLQDRRMAQRSWEVTQVNEMLVQMENYHGIFIATTNLMEGLDQASLRRFDMKLEFKYLQPKQAWKLFKAECGLLGLIPKNRSVLKQQIADMPYLTPGDFAAVKRQHRFSPITSAWDFVERLAEEILVKEKGNERKMGFV